MADLVSNLRELLAAPKVPGLIGYESPACCYVSMTHCSPSAVCQVPGPSFLERRIGAHQTSGPASAGPLFVPLARGEKWNFGKTQGVYY